MTQQHGLILIDKPEGMSSAHVVAVVKRLMNVKKCGHTGTLDPFATGMMILCLNRATKLSRFFLSGGKSYDAVMHLGITTDTQDATGTITSETGIRENAFSPEEIAGICGTFEGKIWQTPPAYSALKHNGVPLYKLARQGKAVTKPPREVTISGLTLTAIWLPEIHFSVSCSSGTYIRTLAADIGGALGCGGHLKKLRRTSSCGMDLSRAVTLDQLREMESQERWTHVIPMAEVLPDMTTYTATESLERTIGFGQPVRAGDIPDFREDATTDFFKIVNKTNDLLAILGYEKSSGLIRYDSVFTG